jgi:uncharacterized membrane protein YccC
VEDFIKRGLILAAAFFISFTASYLILLLVAGSAAADVGASGKGKSAFVGLFAFAIAVVVLTLLFQSMLKPRKPAEGKRLR